MGDAGSDGASREVARDELMSADRRVLVIAAAAMVALVLVGVVAAQLFATSACGDIEPEPVAARPVGPDTATALASAFPDLDDDARRALQGSIDALTAHLGPVAGIADVPDAERLAAVAGGVAAVGSTTTVLDTRVADVRATADLGDGTVVGSGATIWSLALVNPATGQVDALTPLDTTLGAGTCVDTATVGTPFAFLLDAGAGELLLFRVEDDADDPEVELRDDAGRRWVADLEVGTAPPGTLAERLSGRLGEELVAVGRRAADGEDAPVVAAFERADGTPRWTLALADLVDHAPDGDGAVRPEVVTATHGVVVVAVSREVDDGDDVGDRATFVGLDAGSGAVLWEADLPGPRELVAAAPAGDGLTLAVREDTGVTVYEVDLGTGAAHPVAAVAGATAAVAGLDDTLVVAVDDEVTVVTDEGGDATTIGVAVADVLATGDGAIVLLLRTEAGAAAVAFGP